MSVRKRLAQNLRIIRKTKGLSQAKLSKISGVNTTHIGFVENLQVAASVDVLESLAIALKIDPCILLARNSVSFPGSGIKNLQLIPITFKMGEAAYCFWTDQGMEYHPIAKGSYRTALTMIALLQANGFTGKDLLSQAKKLHIPLKQ